MLDTLVFLRNFADRRRRCLAHRPPPSLWRLLVSALLPGEYFGPERDRGVGDHLPGFGHCHRPRAAGAHVDAEKKPLAGFQCFQRTIFWPLVELRLPFPRLAIFLIFAEAIDTQP